MVVDRATTSATCGPRARVLPQPRHPHAARKPRAARVPRPRPADLRGDRRPGRPGERAQQPRDRGLLRGPVGRGTRSLRAQPRACGSESATSSTSRRRRTTSARSSSDQGRYAEAEARFREALRIADSAGQRLIAAGAAATSVASLSAPDVTPRPDELLAGAMTTLDEIGAEQFAARVPGAPSRAATCCSGGDPDSRPCSSPRRRSRVRAPTFAAGGARAARAHPRRGLRARRDQPGHGSAAPRARDRRGALSRLRVGARVRALAHSTGFAAMPRTRRCRRICCADLRPPRRRRVGDAMKVLPGASRTRPAR